MLRQRVHIAILLICAWSVYSQCQGETLLPLIAGIILLISFLSRLRTMDTEFKFFEAMPLSAIIILSLVIGYFFRSAFPLPDQAVSPYPELTAGAQSATIIAAIFLWLKPATATNIYMSMLMAWLTATLSMDVPFTYPIFFKFSVFCLVSLITVILHTSRRPKNKKYIFRYYRDFFLFSFLLVAITIVLFFGISRSIEGLDSAFMDIMKNDMFTGNYTNFLNIQPRLSLTNPGDSAFDRHPVLEVSLPGSNASSVYLKMQVFRDFDNGVWKEAKSPSLFRLPQHLPGHQPRVKMTMFVRLKKDIIPSPAEVTAVQGQGDYVKDVNQIVYGQEKRPTRILTFSTSTTLAPARLTESQIEQYKRIPADIAPELKAISAWIAWPSASAVHKARRIRDFFKHNFQYSLTTNFRADDHGLIAMILEKRPAYCTYFATAMCLLLRAQGVPARVATGFFVTEMMDKSQHTFLARVRDAHAWVEVLLPANDPKTGRRINTWVGFDPTPPSAAEGNIGNNTGFNLERYTEKFWLGVLCFKARMQNMDRAKARLYLIGFLLLTLAFINRRTLWRRVMALFRKRKQKIQPILPPHELQLIYRRYEQYLQKTFQETRRPAETDRDCLERLKKRSDIPAESLAKAEEFVRRYQAMRFGEKKDTRLEGMGWLEAPIRP